MRSFFLILRSIPAWYRAAWRLWADRHENAIWMYWHPARGRERTEVAAYRFCQVLLAGAVVLCALQTADSYFEPGHFTFPRVNGIFRFVSAAIRQPLGWVHILVVTVIFHAWGWKWQWRPHMEQIALTRLSGRECAFYGALSGALPALLFALAHSLVMLTTLLSSSWWAGLPPLLKYETYLLLVMSLFAPVILLCVTVWLWLRLADHFRWALLLLSGSVTFAILSVWYALDRWWLQSGWVMPFLGFGIVVFLARLAGWRANDLYFQILWREDA